MKLISPFVFPILGAASAPPAPLGPWLLCSESGAPSRLAIFVFLVVAGLATIFLYAFVFRRRMLQAERAAASKQNEELLQAYALGAVGQLTAGVAHEINNALAGILGNVQLLLLERKAADPEVDGLRKIERSAKRCKEITQNLLRTASVQKNAEPRALDLNALVRDALSLTASQAKVEGISIVSHFGDGALMVMGNAGHLAQVVIALVSNARLATLKAEVKRIEVTTRQDLDAVLLEIKDTGEGIAAEDLPRIFEPSFTSNGRSNVGLGLSVASWVVSEHHGRIQVATEPGKGSTFSVRLPRLREAGSDG